MTPQNPQMEDGFVALANALYERLYQCCLPAKEMQAVLYVVRVTYGFRMKSGPVYTSEMAEDIDVDQRYGRRLLEALCDRKILIKTSPAKGRAPACYTLNKNWAQWKHDRKNDFPTLKDGRRRVVEYPASQSKVKQITRQSEANYPPKCNEITRLSDTKLPGIVSKDPEQTESRDTPIHNTEYKIHNPPTPKGERGGSESVKDLKDKIREAMTKRGWPPTRKELSKAVDLVMTPTPTAWDKVAWRKHVFRSLLDQCDQVQSEQLAGETVYAPIALAADRVRNKLKIDAMLPPRAS